MFPIHIHEEGKELPADPICYIIAKEGIFMKKNLGIMNSIAKVDNISILASIQSSATMNVPKLPVSAVGKTFAFFREVYKEYSSEAVVIIFYNAEKKTYKIIPPLQKVSGAGLSYDRDVSCEGYDKIGSIHSHANFSAFHSGVDDQDEWSFDGLHITFGHNGSTDGTYTIAASICSNKQRFVVDPMDYMQGIEPLTQPQAAAATTETFRKSGTTYYRWEMGKLVPFDPYEKTAGHYTYRTPATAYEKRYKLLANQRQMAFPKDIWMKLVEKQTYGYAYRQVGGVYGGMGGNWWDQENWDGFGYPMYNRNMPGGGVCGNPRQNGYTNVDPDAWKNNRHVVVKNGRVCIVPGGTPQIAPPPGLPNHPQNVGVKVSPIEFPPHEQDDDFNPCATCMFRDVKIEWAIEMFTEEVEDDLPEDQAKDNYLVHPSLVDASLQTAESEGMPPLNISGADPAAEMYYCEVCQRVYWVSPKEKAECSVCQSPIFKYNKEDQLHEQSSADSGALLIPDGDSFEKTVLAAAKAADSERFLLPEPGKDSIPINGDPAKAPRFTIRKLLQICKGKK